MTNSNTTTTYTGGMLPNVGCECGEWSGEACNWTGPWKATMLMDFMPDHLRGSHRAAGNAGRWSMNGSVRVRVSRECASHMMRIDGDWVSEVA
jgi:hypothetical protein